MAKKDYWLTPDGLLMLEAWARDGLTMEQIASNCGVTRTCFQGWKKQENDIFNALKRGKDPVDIEVENALCKHAIGFTVKVRKTFKLRDELYDPDTGKKISSTERLESAFDEVYVSPDTTAAIFWLKNRKASVWRDKQETAISGSLNVLSDEDKALLEAATEVLGGSG